MKTMYNLATLRKKYERYMGRYTYIIESIHKLEETIIDTTKVLHDSEKALVIVQQVAKETQEELEYHVSEMVTLALDSIFGSIYQFNLNFVIRRGKTEADITLTKNNKELAPITSVGGGVLDIIAFSLRVALWSLNTPKTDRVLILDEPFRNLSKDLHNKASMLLKEISTKLNIQIIVVSHSAELIQHADKIFNTKLVNNQSIVT